MGSKILVALLLIALVLMTFKFMREREARLRERAARAEKNRRRASMSQPSDDTGDQPQKTVTLRKDPKTGTWVPDEEGK